MDFRNVGDDGDASAQRTPHELCATPSAPPAPCTPRGLFQIGSPPPEMVAGDAPRSAGTARHCLRGTACGTECGTACSTAWHCVARVALRAVKPLVSVPLAFSGHQTLFWWFCATFFVILGQFDHFWRETSNNDKKKRWLSATPLKVLVCGLNSPQCHTTVGWASP